jgi:hypothetical protein
MPEENCENGNWIHVSAGEGNGDSGGLHLICDRCGMDCILDVFGTEKLSGVLEKIQNYYDAHKDCPESAEDTIARLKKELEELREERATDTERLPMDKHPEELTSVLIWRNDKILCIGNFYDGSWYFPKITDHHAASPSELVRASWSKIRQ